MTAEPITHTSYIAVKVAISEKVDGICLVRKKWSNSNISVRMYPIAFLNGDENAYNKMASITTSLSDHSQDNSIEASYDGECLKFSNLIVITPIEFRGHDLGTYCMREIVCWAKEFCPADTKAYGLTTHAMGSDFPLRRLAFFNRAGFVLRDHEGLLEDNDVSIFRGHLIATVGCLVVASTRKCLRLIISETKDIPVAKLVESLAYDINGLYKDQTNEISSLRNHLKALQEELQKEEYGKRLDRKYLFKMYAFGVISGVIAFGAIVFLGGFIF